VLEVGELELFEHVGADAIGAKRQVAVLRQVQVVAHVVVHVGAGVVHQEGIAAVEQLDVGRAQVDAVSDQGLAVDKAKLVQPGDGLLAMVVVAVGHVVSVFRHMDMQTATGDLYRFAQHGQPLVGHGEGGVGADMSLHQIGFAPLGFGRIDLLGEQDVLLHPGLQLGEAAVAIRGLEAGHAAQTRLHKPFAQHIQGALDEVGRGVVVDHRAAAALDRFQRADEAAVVEGLLIERPIEPPPEVFQGGDKVRAGGDVGHDPPRQAGVEVVVGTDDARHHQLAAHLPIIRLRVEGPQIGPHRFDKRSFDGDIHPFQHQGRLQLDGGDVLQNKHGWLLRLFVVRSGLDGPQQVVVMGMDMADDAAHVAKGR